MIHHRTTYSKELEAIRHAGEIYFLHTGVTGAAAPTGYQVSLDRVLELEAS